MLETCEQFAAGQDKLDMIRIILVSVHMLVYMDVHGCTCMHIHMYMGIVFAVHYGIYIVTLIIVR